MKCRKCGAELKYFEQQDCFRCPVCNYTLLISKEDAKAMIENDNTVNHPSHYTDGAIEVIDYIEDKGFNYHLGQAIKYISRAGKKNPDKYTEDLKKAVWYLNREIERANR